MQALPDVPESLCIVEMGGPDTSRGEDSEGGSHSGLFLNIGLQVRESCYHLLVGDELISRCLKTHTAHS